jgi:MerR family mercuric resistance operon transcriptional regulator
MKISSLAAAAGVNIETVRYYQRRGLLKEPERPPNGVRKYGPTDVGRLQFIRRAQAMGFSLDEIARLLAIEGQGACAQTRAFIERKLEDVHLRLEALQHLEADLAQLLKECRQVADGGACPTIDRLTRTTLFEPRR